MKLSRTLKVSIAALAATLLLGGCSASEPKATETDKAPAAASTVTITDNHGEIAVPVKPESVVALDNTMFHTLSDWGIKLTATAKGVMGKAYPFYTDDASVLDLGNHREPDLEKVVEAKPDLVLSGYRFGSYYDELKKLTPKTIEISPRDDKDHTAELQRQTEILGKIFDREDDAKKLIKGLDDAIASAKSSYNGADTVMALIVSGGKIGYVAPITGRSFGMLYPQLGLKPAIEQAAEDTTHGDDLSAEAIAQANPDWFIVLDREGAFGKDDYVPAQEVIENSAALKNVTAVAKGQIIYADAAFYLDEGIQVYTDLYANLAKAFKAAK